MNCRFCKALLTVPFVDLGSAPPSNAYLTPQALNAPETWYPLRVMVCTNCWLVQTEDFAAREAFFSSDYAYFSSMSSSWLAHAKAYVGRMSEMLALDASSCVVEVASNDGYLLQYVKERGIPCYGIEPTASTAAAARKIGIETLEVFFGEDKGRELARQGRAAHLTVANNVLAHVPDIGDFVRGFAALLQPQGVSTFEFPHLLRLLNDTQFDTIYHEHYSYLSLIAVDAIFKANGLGVFDVEELPTHGGSLRVYAQRIDTGKRSRTARVDGVLSAERAKAMDKSSGYDGFQAKSERVKDDLLEALINAKRKGLKVGAYGAAAKGNTLMNFAGIRPDLVPYVVDKSPSKQGHAMPGSRIPIVNEAHLRADRPDIILILPWNLKAEIAAQLDYARAWGGKIMTAVPHLTIQEI